MHEHQTGQPQEYKTLSLHPIDPIPLWHTVVHLRRRYWAERILIFMTDNLDQAAYAAQQYMALKHAARERALPKSRTAIRFCANSIRATHRQEFQTAADLLHQAAVLLAEMAADL